MESTMPVEQNTDSKTRPTLQSERRKIRRRRATLQEQCPNSDQACRLCLRVGLVPITIQLAADIFYALDLHVEQDDSLPQLVCRTCSVRVCRFARFKRKVHHAHHRLTDKKTFKHTEEEHSSPVREVDSMEAPWDVGESQDRVGSGDEGAEDAHGEQLRCVCRKCKRAFNIQAEYDSHVAARACSRRRANAREVFVCEVCGKACKTKSTLQNHCLVHTTELKYACDQCPYKARWRTALLHHTRVHTGERPVRCPHCPARFVSPSNLASHRRTHFPPQFKCTSCDRSFTNKQGLDNHMASQHSNVKAHVCNICGKSFSTRRLMRRHELKNHNCPKRRGGSTPVYIQLQRDMHHDDASPQY